MNRRKFIGTGAATLGGVALAGCSGEETRPPARKAKVFEDVSVDGTTLSIDLRSDVVVETRQEDVQNALGAPSGVLGALLPVGVARAAKGKGATGRGSGGYSSAPHGRHGWAVWHGHDDDDWRENHEDELTMADATVAALGVGYIGDDDAYERSPPGPGYQQWDESWSDPKDGAEKTANLAAVTPGSDVQPGWLRIGTHLTAENGDVDFGWQGADMEIDTDGRVHIDKAWHVRPRV